MSKLLETIEIETRPNPEVAIIWMHGLGTDGNDFAGIVPQLAPRALPGIRYIFPHAPHMPITFQGGYVMRAWYDIMGTDIAKREHEGGLRASQLQIEALIAREKERGIPASRIILAGFSQGCAMVLQTGLRHPEPLAGFMCLSGYLPLADKMADERSQANLSTPIFMAHGHQDGVIPFARAVQSRDALKALGYQIEWHEYPMQHSVSDQEIKDIGLWLKKVLAS